MCRGGRKQVSNNKKVLRRKEESATTTTTTTINSLWGETQVVFLAVKRTDMYFRANWQYVAVSALSNVVNEALQATSSQLRVTGLLIGKMEMWRKANDKRQTLTLKCLKGTDCKV